MGKSHHFDTTYLLVTECVPSPGWDTLEDRKIRPNRCMQRRGELFGCEIKCAGQLESGLAVQQMKF